MLNRRFLRALVMQAQYGLRLERAASGDVAFGHIEQGLRAGLFDQGLTNEWLAERLDAAREALALLERQPPQDRTATFFEEDVRGLATAGLKKASDQYAIDVKVRRRGLQTQLELAYHFYLKVLSLSGQMVRQVLSAESRAQRRHLAPEPATAAQMRLASNPYMEAIEQSPELAQALKNQAIDWVGEDERMVERLYREGLTQNPTYQQYLLADQVTPADDLRMARWMLKTFLPNSAIVNEYFEEQHYGYSELRPAVVQLIQDTLRQWAISAPDEAQEPTDADETSDEPEAHVEGPTASVIPPLPVVSRGEDWAEALSFAERLYDATLTHELTTHQVLAETVTNWDVSRIALLDLIMIEMAVAEFIALEQVSTRITINEYIELSKAYSTPQSYQFLNANLDRIAQILTERGLVRKSGRGLIEL